MNPGDIYAKTEAGQREVKERKLNLSVAIRSALIMIDGKHTAADIMERMRVMHVDESVFATLEKEGLIAAKQRTGGSSVAGDNAGSQALSEDTVQRYLDAQRLMSKAINEHLGFRGYGLMMRLQRTSNVADLRGFLPDLAKALVKRMGIDGATPVVIEIERLLAG